MNVYERPWSIGLNGGNGGGFPFIILTEENNLKLTFYINLDLPDNIIYKL